MTLKCVVLLPTQFEGLFSAGGRQGTACSFEQSTGERSEKKHLELDLSIAFKSSMNRSTCL